jgi:hypothetical protein
MPFEPIQLPRSKRPFPQEPAGVGNNGERGKTETGERLDKAVGRLRPFCQELYNHHLRKLTILTDELIEDVEKGNLEPRRRPAKTSPGAQFAGLDLVRVYRAQNKRLWPFLSQHLDNEFTDPLLSNLHLPVIKRLH